MSQPETMGQKTPYMILHLFILKCAKLWYENVIYFLHYAAGPPPQALKVVGMASELAHKAEFWRERPILV